MFASSIKTKAEGEDGGDTCERMRLYLPFYVQSRMEHEAENLSGDWDHQPTVLAFSDILPLLR